MELSRRRWLASFVALVLAACATVEPAPQPLDTPARELRFVVLHTNDVHGQALPRKGTWIDRQNPPPVGGLARLAGYVNQVREEARREGFELLVLDAGDWFQGTPEGGVDDGLEFTRGLALIGYDAMCVGNHELDKGLANLRRILDATRVPAVCANLSPRGSTARVDWVPPWRVVERAGVSIGIVGLLSQETPEITHADAQTLDFVAPAEALARAVRELGPEIDWVLPLTHLGVEDDQALAREVRGLPLIVGGHSHTRLTEGRREGETLIAQAGTKLSVVGRVELVVRVPGSREADQKLRVLESSAKLVDLLAEPEERFRSRGVEELCAALAQHTEESMRVVVGELAEAATRSRDPLVSGSAGNLIADLLRARAGAEVGLMNRGGIRTDLEAGPLTRREIFENMPFDNTLVTIGLRGAELTEMLRRSVEGTAHSGLEVSGLTVEVALDAAQKRVLTGLRVGEAPVDPARAYRVAMNSFMADGGDAYLDKGAGVTRLDSGLLIRDVLEDAFVQQKVIRAATENRYKVVMP